MGGGHEATFSARHASFGVSDQQLGIEYEEPNNNDVVALIDDQVQRLLSLIKPSKLGYEKLAGKASWIIDSRASRHMIGELQNLQPKTTMIPIPINLSNGEHVMENVEGSMNLSHEINLDNILYISNFSCNLISMAQRIRELKCIVIFDEELCVIQDRTSKSPIVVGRLREGVYYFDKISPPTMQFNMAWLGHLGYPSDKVLSLFSKSFDTSGNWNNGPCDIYFRAKQARAQFVDRESHAKELFDLVHCDIWVVYRLHSIYGAQ